MAVVQVPWVQVSLLELNIEMFNLIQMLFEYKKKSQQSFSALFGKIGRLASADLIYMKLYSPNW